MGVPPAEVTTSTCTLVPGAGATGGVLPRPSVGTPGGTSLSIGTHGGTSLPAYARLGVNTE